MATRLHGMMPGGFGRFAFAFGLALGPAACQIPPGPAVDPAPFVLTVKGDDVLSDAPAGLEVTLGSKRLRPLREAIDSE